MNTFTKAARFLGHDFNNFGAYFGAIDRDPDIVVKCQRMPHGVKYGTTAASNDVLNAVSFTLDIGMDVTGEDIRHIELLHHGHELLISPFQDVISAIGVLW